VEDRRARFERLYENCSPDIAMYALRRTDRETAQDVVAETFTVAWRRLDKVPEKPLPWLYGVARRVLANQRRSARRLTSLRRKLEADADTAPELADPELAAALRGLPAIDREILALVAWEGLTAAEAERSCSTARQPRRGFACTARALASPLRSVSRARTERRGP
jgi:RNA polymerase sigma-70 factor, ECF subfamily